MNFYSTNGSSPQVSFRTGVVKSLPPDNGLYFPQTIPDLSRVFRSGSLSLHEFAMEILKPFTAPDIPHHKLEQVVEDTFSFPLPVIRVNDDIHVLELFHGPTYAFKDIGARFLARCLGFFQENKQKEVTILVATSGDTGGAVASGFLNVPAINVIILYPSGKVSRLQEKQLTTHGSNITALEIDGTFDDCQHLVKTAFLDHDLNKKLSLSSANSINIARWIPQSIYFSWACRQMNTRDVIFSVPSGNYGNLAAGLLAKRMGAPIRHFIASANMNDTVPRYLKTGKYEPRPTIPTYANAMDVSNPGNFPRMMALCNRSYSQLKQDIKGHASSDNDIIETMRSCWIESAYLLDPHGAAGFIALRESGDEGTKVFLATAHPCKFDKVVKKAVARYELPAFTAALMAKDKQAIRMDADFGLFKAFLMK